MKVLLIEDNETLGGFLKDILTLKKYYVEWLKDGIDVDFYCQTGGYDILLLDWMLPSTTGIEVIKKLRAQNIQLPVIMLTAKSEVSDKVEGLTTGADDYLTKPFDMDELEARMISVVKRYQALGNNTKSIGNITLDIIKHEFLIEESIINLTQKEYQLLELLFLNQIVSREMILEKIWSIDQIVGDNNIDALIRLLKKKLVAVHANVKVKNIRGVGYKLEVMQ
ncbi:response regulator transcription factor [Macrococcus capreoli]|uniref:response regulator transcription factor n=1 Tax=Macrococcus capreoli TaxID=2982690 RepID=UPI0021D5AA9B|nr:response regulator transcription factor [Macrococcus sp. TMW 2.2395]MCU7558239.1 response regulator transcription factor [Macrococcus sp. TMW 2.2395]